jgi:hypothetical protein
MIDFLSIYINNSGFKEIVSSDSNLQDKDRILREKEEEVI